MRGVGKVPSAQTVLARGDARATRTRIVLAAELADGSLSLRPTRTVLRVATVRTFDGGESAPCEHRESSGDLFDVGTRVERANPYEPLAAPAESRAWRRDDLRFVKQQIERLPR